MGPLTDKLFLEVWKYLRMRPDQRVMLSTLNAPRSGLDNIRIAWTELQNYGRPEGFTKQKKLKHILGERPDLFLSFNAQSGHPAIMLTPAAGAIEYSEVLPSVEVVAAVASQMPAPSIPMGFESSAAPNPHAGRGSALAAATSAYGAGMQMGGMGMIMDMGQAAAMASWAATGPAAGADLAALAAASAASSANALEMSMMKRNLEEMTAAATSSAAASMPPVKRQRTMEGVFQTATTAAWGSGYDLIWTPTLAAIMKRDEVKEKEMCRAMLDAIENYKGVDVSVSMIGFDCKVSELKKQVPFKNEKLQDVLKRHEDIFGMVPDHKGGISVKILPGAVYAIYEPEELLNKMRMQALLPEKIDNPNSLKERYQALRIEIVHALHKRNGRCAVQAVGQEPGIQRHKTNISQAKKLQDFVQLFPQNFALTINAAEGPGAIVTLISYDVSDLSTIETAIVLSSMSSGKGKKGGYGGYGGKGGGAPSFSPQMNPNHMAMAALASGRPSRWSAPTPY